LTTEKASNLLNVLSVGVISLVTIFFLWYQDYTGTVDILTWASIIGMTIWGAAYSYKQLSTNKFITFALMAMLIGFLTEFVGFQEGLWNFGAHNPPMYIVTGWVLLVLTMLILTELGNESKVIPTFATSEYDSYIGVLIPISLFGFLFGTLGEYRSATGMMFFAYYITLTILCALYYYHYPNTRKLLLAVVAAWIVGSLSEIIGASSSLWSFTYGFPIWIVISCWSLEWLIILAVVGFLFQSEVLTD